MSWDEAVVSKPVPHYPQSVRVKDDPTKPLKKEIETLRKKLWQAEQRYEELLSRAFPNEARKFPVVKAIIRKTCHAHGLYIKDIQSKWATKHISYCRQHIMYLLLVHTRLGPNHIARLLDRDHSTVCFGVKRHRKRIADRFPIPVVKHFDEHPHVDQIKVSLSKWTV